MYGGVLQISIYKFCIIQDLDVKPTQVTNYSKETTGEGKAANNCRSFRRGLSSIFSASYFKFPYGNKEQNIYVYE